MGISAGSAIAGLHAHVIAVHGRDLHIGNELFVSSSGFSSFS
jgi:hypothetical protein